ncbi:MAG: hypothetical protein ACK5WY_06030 [Holosporaceae bacterium]|jgi:hypothetical protein|nr:hypothetical protein [Rhodospirillaceae bacterium]
MQKAKPDTMKIARDTFSKIAEKFPHLIITENKNDPVEISLTIPKQPGLKFKVWLCLQNNDELHFSVGHFWLAWFPCTDSQIVEHYIEAVIGFLSGNYRVLEHYRGRWCINAVLQKPQDNRWESIGSWATGWGIFLKWLPETFKEVRNF